MSTDSLVCNAHPVNFLEWEHAAILHEILHEDEGHGVWFGMGVHQCADGITRSVKDGVCECGATYCAECDEAIR